jgi:hypothetical protein
MTLVPQNGKIPPTPMECHLEMMSVTLDQWCAEENLEPLNPRSYRQAIPNTVRVFHLDTTDDSSLNESVLIDGYNTSSAHSDNMLSLGTTSMSSDAINTIIEHMVCYVDRPDRSLTYPKFDACGLPGHKIEQCHPLVNFCLAQAFNQKRPDLVKRIKSAYQKFPRSHRPPPSKISSVTQVIEFLELPDVAEHMDLLSSLHTVDLDRADAYHGQGPDSMSDYIVSFHKHPWFASASENTAVTVSLSP